VAVALAVAALFSPAQPVDGAFAAAAPDTLAPPPVNPADRASVRRLADEWYRPAVDRLSGWRWNGSVDTCTPGTVVGSTKDDGVRMINAYRALYGVRPVASTSVDAVEVQEAALMMAAEMDLSHSPPSSWACWSQAGSDGAAVSNLALAPPPHGVGIFMDDPGANNSVVGHRRWLLRETAEAVQFGFTSDSTAADVVIDSSTPGVESPPFAGWPVVGYNPIEFLTDRWHYDYQGVDPSADWDATAAQVVVTQGGLVLDTVLHSWPGEPTFTVDIVDLRFADLMTCPEGDVTFSVAASGFVAGGEDVPEVRYDVTYAAPAGGCGYGPYPGWPPISPSFADTSGHTFEADIAWLAGMDITRGCDVDLFCPDEPVTRSHMAAFLVRALPFEDRLADPFIDDDDSVFVDEIERLAAAGVTRGCNPPVHDRFCPDDIVTRGQMAAFLVRALGLVGDGGGNRFVDDDGSVFEGDIARLAAAGITRGCNPPTNDRFCPGHPVTRGQMAAFLRRALE
jgi:hypothetical protein